jgi:hypothetical protein
MGANEAAKDMRARMTAVRDMLKDISLAGIGAWAEVNTGREFHAMQTLTAMEKLIQRAINKLREVAP